jgi:hypothetical protein
LGSLDISEISEIVPLLLERLFQILHFHDANLSIIFYLFFFLKKYFISGGAHLINGCLIYNDRVF